MTERLPRARSASESPASFGLWRYIRASQREDDPDSYLLCVGYHAARAR
jgi:hypothetical protein